MTRLYIGLAALLLGGAVGCSDAPATKGSHPVKLIVLGIDGMDPVLLDRAIQSGRAPNLKAMAEAGTYVRMATSNPPQSPVAWSHVTTGAHSDLHGIYDFVHRNPKAMSPYLSTSRVDPGDALSIGSLALTTSSPEVKLLRDGEVFWNILGSHGVPSTAVKVPANFPPPSSRGAEMLSGMGTPDLLGTPGTFQVLTNQPDLIDDGDPSGGIVRAMKPATEQTVRGTLVGPPDPLSSHGEALVLDVEVTVDAARGVALVQLGDVDVLLTAGEWSDWVPIAFDAGLIAGDVPGMVRLFAKSISPHVVVYVSPINLDPTDAVMPVSSPASYAVGLAGDAGRFYTQGMPEDTKALAAGILTDDEFLAQAELVFQERLRMLDRELDRFEGGMLFFYFSSIDQTSHVFWRALGPDAPAELWKYADVIPSLYERIDKVVGDVRQRHPDAVVMVMSDHGFSPYTRKVHLNTWLEQRGYLALREDGTRGEGPLGHIDWTRTQAYALGLQQLFINVEGRERGGIVPPGEREVVMDRIERELIGFRDPDNGRRVVTRVYRPVDEAHPGRVPDMLIGYNRGYRSSDQSAMGAVGSAVVEQNTDKWSGDHCMDPSHVPGVLLSTVPLDTGDGASLVDLAPTFLSYFGVEPPAAMAGRAMLGPAPGVKAP